MFSTRSLLPGILAICLTSTGLAAGEDFSDFNGRYKTRTTAKERRKSAVIYGFNAFRAFPDGTLKAAGSAYIRREGQPFLRKTFTAKGRLTTLASNAGTSLARGTITLSKLGTRGTVTLRTFTGQQGLVRGTMKLKSKKQTSRVFLVKGL
jgi:hypothetical protein